MDNPIWFTETEGILSADETDLKLEFRTSDSICGVIKSPIHEVILPLDKIEAITFSKQFKFWASITIRVTEMRAAAEIPAYKQGEIELSIDTKHIESAEKLVASVQLALDARKKTT